MTAVDTHLPDLDVKAVGRRLIHCHLNLQVCCPVDCHRFDISESSLRLPLAFEFLCIVICTDIMLLFSLYL